ncbi:MAG TPA: fructosamine kinase family protein [Dongiaceae bacterium]|nr:fructosamine kinase family protein [Dongiaceae bacterium]
MNRAIQAAIQQKLAAEMGAAYGQARLEPSGTGCINSTWSAQARGVESLFIKLGAADALAMYEQEIAGLQTLRACTAIRVPHVHFSASITADDGSHSAVLVLEFIALSSPRPQHDATIGTALAQLHDIQGPAFGFEADNVIGRTPQINHWRQNWWEFWCQNRLQPQRRLAQLRGMRAGLLEKLDHLIERIPQYFGDHQPQPSLLHGDLWSGNLAVDEQGRPVLYDPAVYFGDGETDLAMLRMFGGVRPAVFAAYHQQRPAQSGLEQRRPLYDFYHWLNHFNLFGVGYLGQVENTLDTLLAFTEFPGN